MLKYKGVIDGQILIGLGLSSENIRRLRQGHPILFNADVLGLKDTKITIFYGQTEEKMYNDLVKAGLLKVKKP